MADGDPLNRACELVGRFLYYFSRVEARLDEAITKLFKLDPETAPIVTANLDFHRKLYIVRSAVNYQNPKSTTPIKNVDETFSQIDTQNNGRQVVAHCSFEADPSDGVKFKRVVAKKEMKSDDPHWTEKDFEGRFATLQRLEGELAEIVRKIEPDRIVWPTASAYGWGTHLPAVLTALGIGNSWMTNMANIFWMSATKAALASGGITQDPQQQALGGRAASLRVTGGRRLVSFSRFPGALRRMTWNAWHSTRKAPAE
jgi:hypothetical protein